MRGGGGVKDEDDVLPTIEALLLTVDLRESLWAGFGEGCFAIWMACNSCSSLMIRMTSKSLGPVEEERGGGGGVGTDVVGLRSCGWWWSPVIGSANPPYLPACLSRLLLMVVLVLLLLLLLAEDALEPVPAPSFLYLSLLSVGMARFSGSDFLTAVLVVPLSAMLYSPTISMLLSESSSRLLRAPFRALAFGGVEVDAWAIGGGWSW